MHLTTGSLSLALCALNQIEYAQADAQVPLTERAKQWFQAAKSAVPTVPGLTVPTIPKPVKSPVNAATAHVAALTVHKLNMSNFDTMLAPKSHSAITEWMIYVTGGNKTCAQGYCHNLDVAWNETASILAADPMAPKLGLINCDEQTLLCTTIAAGPPTIWHVQRPAIGSGEKTNIHINFLNGSTTTASDMVALHTGKKFENGYLYEGFFHAFDGLPAQYGVRNPVGLVLYLFSLVPSWGMMLIISFGTRFFIHRKNAPQDTPQQRAAAVRAQAANKASTPKK